MKQFEQAHRPKETELTPTKHSTLDCDKPITSCVFCDKQSTCERTVVFENKDIGTNIISLCDSHEKFNRIAKIEGPIPGKFGDMYIIHTVFNAFSNSATEDCFPLFPNGLSYD